MTFFLDQDVPDDLIYSLRELGYEVLLLRNILPVTTADVDVMGYAASHGYVLITCNRDDFVIHAETERHAGIIVVIRRKTRIAERIALIRLLDRAGEPGIQENINFA